MQVSESYTVIFCLINIIHFLNSIIIEYRKHREILDLVFDSLVLVFN